MTDKPANDKPDEDEAVTDDEAVPEPGAPAAPAAPAGRGGRTVRLGAIVLIALGLLGTFLGATTAADPEQAQCSQARSILEDEGEEEDAGDVPCDEALSRAAALDAEDEEDEVDAVAEESTVRTFALIVGAIGVLQIVGAVLTMRLRSKGARLVALVGTALGIVFSPLGLIAVPILGFVVYALLFSGDARAVFGDPGGPRMFRPRT